MKHLITTLMLQLLIFGFLLVAAEANLCRINCEIDFETRGCYRDESRKRALPHYIYNERDPSSPNYGGRRIDWLNWNLYFPGFVCRCAQKAKELGYDLFGVQFYGECWAGHSNVDNYTQHGKDVSGGCIGDDFQSCPDDARYCVGKHLRNMIYQIVDTSCSEASFERVGCFKDLHRRNKRPLPKYLFTDRDTSIQKFSGQRVDWRNWDVYVPQFACRCAKAAKAHGASFFGMQFYGECWSGKYGQLTYNIDGPSPNGCIDSCYKPCKENSEYCSGKHFANYVYKLKDAPCDVSITPVGCYKENPLSLIMKDVFYNEANPGKPHFGGSLLQWSKNLTADFSNLLCRCARYARDNGWEYFGVREVGVCVRSSPLITDYGMYGLSNKCFERKPGVPCPFGSLLCGGSGNEANYVYRINLG